MVLINNRPRELFAYVYTHPVVLDNLVRHVGTKSICEVLTQMLSSNESMLEEEYDFEGVRISFVFKIVDKMLPECSFEDNMDAQAILCDLAEQRTICAALCSPHAFAKY